jgi:hypothetical protein
MLRCLGESETNLVLLEVHEGVCGSHIGGRALAAKLLRAGYCWPTLLQDCAEFVKKCDKCQRFSDKKHAPANELTSIFSPWPFCKWLVDIVGPFLIAPGQLMFFYSRHVLLHKMGRSKSSSQTDLYIFTEIQQQHRRHIDSSQHFIINECITLT